MGLIRELQETNTLLLKNVSTNLIALSPNAREENWKLLRALTGLPWTSQGTLQTVRLLLQYCSHYGGDHHCQSVCMQQEMSKATLVLPLPLASAEITLPLWALKYQGYSWASSGPNSTCSQSWDPVQLWRAASIPWATAKLRANEKTTIMPGRSSNPEELLFKPPTPSSHPIRHWRPLSLGKVLAPISLCL